MVVLEHVHSLCLIDLNPKYPHDEIAYDDEEDLIIKQAFQCLCDRCDKNITYYHRYYFKCDQCDYSLHKLCKHLPTMLEHASHSAHNLTLFLNKSQGQCHVCKSILHEQLFYHCSECMFNICLDCGMDEVQYHAIYHPSHQHPLIPFCRGKQILAECDACGKKHEGVFYECLTCLRSCIHNICVFQPKRLLIQDGTCGRFFHTHPLILAHSFPKEYQKAKFYPTCRVCENSFSHNENLWIYKCEKCRYYVHLDCANLRPETSDSDKPSSSGMSMISSNNYEDDPDDPRVLRLPVSYQTYNIVKDFFFKESKEKIITHISHEHPLILVDPMNKVKDLCNGCVKPILMELPYYKCSLYDDGGCNFVLHDWCTRWPRELKGSIDHPQHTLVLLTNMPDVGHNLFRCKACYAYCNGFAYRCVKCKYTVDVVCAFFSSEITHKSHPHHLLLTNDDRLKQRLEKDYCRMCLSGFTDDNHKTSLSCERCKFHLHPECALLLPETIRHRYDKHPMTLCYGPVENHEGDYFCEVCEEELNPYACFYHCHECAQSMHSACAALKPQSLHIYKLYVSDLHRLTMLSLIMKGSISLWDYWFDTNNTKRGSIYKTRDHPHPLSLHLKRETESGTLCGSCEGILRSLDLILKCQECRYAIHCYHIIT